MNDKLTSKASREALTWHGLKSGAMVAHNISHYYTQVKLLAQYMPYGIHIQGGSEAGGQSCQSIAFH